MTYSRRLQQCEWQYVAETKGYCPLTSLKFHSLEPSCLYERWSRRQSTFHWKTVEEIWNGTALDRLLSGRYVDIDLSDSMRSLVLTVSGFSASEGSCLRTTYWLLLPSYRAVMISHRIFANLSIDPGQGWGSCPLLPLPGAPWRRHCTPLLVTEEHCAKLRCSGARPRVEPITSRS